MSAEPLARPRRGAWRRVPLYVLVPLAAATRRRGHPPAAVIAVIGYYLPLLGIPLATFLAVDIAVGEIARRRATTPAAGPRFAISAICFAPVEGGLAWLPWRWSRWRMS